MPRVTGRNADTCAEKVLLEAVDLDDPDLRTVLVEAAAVGVNVTDNMVESLREETLARREAAEKAAAEAEMRAIRPKPFWQLEDCPNWCKADHHDDDTYWDQFHSSGCLKVSLVTGEMPADGAAAPYVAVEVRHFTGQAQPKIAIQMASGDDLMIQGLTRDGAVRLAKNLMTMFDIAKPEADQ